MSFPSADSGIFTKFNVNSSSTASYDINPEEAFLEQEFASKTQHSFYVLYIVIMGIRDLGSNAPSEYPG